jgi:hypothetical protein
MKITSWLEDYRKKSLLIYDFSYLFITHFIISQEDLFFRQPCTKDTTNAMQWFDIVQKIEDQWNDSVFIILSANNGLYPVDMQSNKREVKIKRREREI